MIVSFLLRFRLENGFQQMNLNHHENRLQASERAMLTARITELQEKINLLEER